MTLDTSLERLLRNAYGNGTRSERIAFKKHLRTVRDALSTTDVATKFAELCGKAERPYVAACVAASALAREGRMSEYMLDWARTVMNVIGDSIDPTEMNIQDRLHPSKLEEYAGGFVKATSMP